MSVTRDTRKSPGRPWMLPPIVLLTLGGVQLALASLPALEEHELDPQEVALDRSAPEAPVVSSVDLKEGRPPEDLGCGEYKSTSEDGTSVLTLILQPPLDDRTPADHLGYLLRTEGQLPRGLAEVLPRTAVRTNGNDRLIYAWEDADVESTEHCDFIVQLVAVDLAGNESEPSAPWHVIR